MADENIRGARQLAEFLATLPAKVEKNIMRSGLHAGAAVFRDEVKPNIAVVSSKLKRSVRVSVRSKRGKLTASMKIGGKKAPHAHFYEYGTKPHKIVPKKAGGLLINGQVAGAADHPGARPHPTVRPAFDTKSTAAIAAVAAQIRKRLTKEGINAPAPEDA